MTDPLDLASWTHEGYTNSAPRPTGATQLNSTNTIEPTSPRITRSAEHTRARPRILGGRCRCASTTSSVVYRHAWSARRSEVSQVLHGSYLHGTGTAVLRSFRWSRAMHLRIRWRDSP
jgi:hypothetical protein